MPLGEGRQSGQRTAEKSIEGRANTLPNGLFALFWRCWEGGQSGHAKNNLAEVYRALQPAHTLKNNCNIAIVRCSSPLPKSQINARAPAWPPGRQGAPHLARGAALAEVWAACAPAH